MKRAPTLVGFLVLTAILGFVAAIMMPTDIGGARHSARKASCQSNLKQIALAFAQYTQDYDGKLPLVARRGSRGWADDVNVYTKNWRLFQCPETSGSLAETSDYFYNARLNGAELGIFTGKASTIKCGDGPDDAPLSSSLSALPPDAVTNENSFAQRHLNGANYLFVDGHVKWFKPEKISTKSASQVGVPTFSLQ